MRRGKHQHPILTWGNGSASLSSNYTFFLKHMASWGFVIIAAQDKNSGVGQTILDGANFLTAANSNPVSIFFHKLNVSQVGSFGHSQGATGAINALINQARSDADMTNSRCGNRGDREGQMICGLFSDVPRCSVSKPDEQSP